MGGVTKQVPPQVPLVNLVAYELWSPSDPRWKWVGASAKRRTPSTAGSSVYSQDSTTWPSGPPRDDQSEGDLCMSSGSVNYSCVSFRSLHSRRSVCSDTLISPMNYKRGDRATPSRSSSWSSSNHSSLHSNVPSPRRMSTGSIRRSVRYANTFERRTSTSIESLQSLQSPSPATLASLRSGLSDDHSGSSTPSSLSRSGSSRGCLRRSSSGEHVNEGDAEQEKSVEASSSSSHSSAQIESVVRSGSVKTEHKLRGLGKRMYVRARRLANRATNRR